MPRKESEAVPEGKGSIHLYVLPGGISLENFRRMMSEAMDNFFDKHIGIVREIYEEPFRSTGEKVGRDSGDDRGTDQREASLEQDARQPRLAMEPDGHADTKTRKRTEGAATAVQAMHGNSCSADRVDSDPTCSTSFGDDCTGSPAPPSLGKDTLVENVAAAPNSCPPSLEIRSPTAAGGLLLAGDT